MLIKIVVKLTVIVRNGRCFSSGSGWSVGALSESLLDHAAEVFALADDEVEVVVKGGALLGFDYALSFVVDGRVHVFPESAHQTGHLAALATCLSHSLSLHSLLRLRFLPKRSHHSTRQLNICHIFRSTNNRLTKDSRDRQLKLTASQKNAIK